MGHGPFKTGIIAVFRCRSQSSSHCFICWRARFFCGDSSVTLYRHPYSSSSAGIPDERDCMPVFKTGLRAGIALQTLCLIKDHDAHAISSPPRILGFCSLIYSEDAHGAKARLISWVNQPDSNFDYRFYYSHEGHYTNRIVRIRCGHDEPFVIAQLLDCEAISSIQ